MGIPQIILIGLYAMSLGIAAVNNGKESKTNFLASLVTSAIVFGLLIWGGFFC